MDAGEHHNLELGMQNALGKSQKTWFKYPHIVYDYPSAQIFSVADYGFVGYLHDILPLMTAESKNRGRKGFKYLT